MSSNSQCKTCNHPERSRIELHLSRRTPLRLISKKFGVSITSLHRHRHKHLSTQLRMALAIDVPENLDLDQLRRQESESLLQRIVAYLHRAEMALAEAEDIADFPNVARLHSRILNYLGLEARILGEIQSAAKHSTTNVIFAPVYLQLRQGLQEALAPHPEARQAVAQLLHRIEAEMVTDDVA